MRDEVIEWRNEKNLSKEMGEVVKLRAQLLDELIEKELLTLDERAEVEKNDQVKIASQTIIIEPDDPESLNANLTIEKKIINLKANGEAFKVGEDVIYQIIVKNIGSTTVGNIVVEDTLTAKDLNTGKEEIRKEWTFKEMTDKDGNIIGNKLKPEQEGYIIYKYKIIQEDLRKELSNKAKVKGKNKIPQGEKPVVTPVDKPTGTLTITKTFTDSQGFEIDGINNTAKAQIKVEFNEGKEYEYYCGDSEERKKVKSGDIVYIAHGEAVNIIGLPNGLQYTITETEAPAGYNTILQPITGTINLSDKIVNVESIVNTKGATLPETSASFMIGGDIEGTGTGGDNLLEQSVTWSSELDESFENVETNLKIYHIANITNLTEQAFNYEYIEEFKKYQLPWPENNDEWKTLASTLVSYIVRDSIKPTWEGIVKSGEKTEIGSMPAKGLYLMTHDRFIVGNSMCSAIHCIYTPINKPEGETEFYVTNPKIIITGGKLEKIDSIQRRALVVWNDEGHENERPAQISLALLRDGEVYVTVDLSAENGWRYTWENLDISSEWNVVETSSIARYKVNIDLQGTTFVVTLTYAQDNLPPTNDTTPDNPPPPDDNPPV